MFTVLTLEAIASRDEEVLFPSGRIYSRRAFEVLQPARETAAQLEVRLDEIGGFFFVGQYLQGLFRWEERETRQEFQQLKRPKGWKPGDKPDPEKIHMAFFILNAKDDIKARYFGGYDIYGEYQRDSWMTLEEWEADAVIHQDALLEETRQYA